MPDRLYRSRRERMIGGVAGGIAEMLRIDPTIVRIGWIVLAFATNGAAALVYFVMLFLVPEAPDEPAATADASTATGGPAAGGTAAGGTTPASARPPAASWARRSEGSGDRRTGALVAGAILVLVGGFFLVRQYLPAIVIGLGWPIVAVALGVILVVAALRTGGRSG